MSTLDLGYVADGDSLACGESAQRDAELVPEREDRTLAANDDHSHLMRDAASVFRIESGQPVLKLAMITCLASDAGSMAYCSILAMTRSRSRASKRRMSLIRPCPPFNIHFRARTKKCPHVANISSEALSSHRQRLLVGHCRPLCVKTSFPSRYNPAAHNPGGTPYGASVKRDVAAFRGQVCPPSVLNCACLPHSHRNISAAWLAASHISR